MHQFVQIGYNMQFIRINYVNDVTESRVQIYVHHTHPSRNATSLCVWETTEWQIGWRNIEKFYKHFFFYNAVLFPCDSCTPQLLNYQP